MNQGYIELELDQMDLEQKSHMQKELVTKSKLVSSAFQTSSLYQQLNVVAKHNISGMINKVCSEIEGVKNTMDSLQSYVLECHSNYSSLDTFLTNTTSLVTTSSSTNFVVSNMSSLDDINLDFQIPDSKIKLEYEFSFHPVVQEEKKQLESHIPYNGKIGKPEVEER